jgi:uncharacterized protein (TIGR02117 family)
MNVKIPLGKKCLRFCQRAMKWSLITFLLYMSVLLVGLIPVNNGFVPSKQGVRIFLVSNAVHADVIVPVLTETVDWRDRFSDTRFVGDASFENHVAFGWGDKGFFLETETWHDLKISTAAKALLLPSSSCLHVAFTRPEYHANRVAVTISYEQYARLVSFIESSFLTNAEGEPVQIRGYAYSSTDAFFEAHGRYHLFNTCNSWVGRALRHAGVRTPWLTPLPKSPMLYIESEEFSTSPPR